MWVKGLGFPKLGVTSWGPYEKGILPIWGSILGVPCFRKPPMQGFGACVTVCVPRFLLG